MVSEVPLAAGSSVSRRIALTFDDGPDPEVTPRVLDALASAHAKATFFLCGERVAAHPELVARIVAEGHDIGNHSWQHDALVLRSAAEIARDLKATNDAIVAACGVHPEFFRPPYGVRDPRVLSAARELAMIPILWSESPRDWKEPDAGVIAERVLSSARDGAIVLLHDGDAVARKGRPHTALALPQILEGLAARGIRAVTIRELLATGDSDAATR